MKRIFISLLLIGFIVSMSGCIVSVSQVPAQKTIETPSKNVTSAPLEPAWTPPAVHESAPVLPSIADVVEEVYPTVVTISTEVTTQDFFYGPQTLKGAGSGWVIDKDGVIVTNNHVVEGAEKVTIELADGRTFQVGPSNVYRDPTTDLAIIKIDVSNLSAASVGDSAQLRVGDWVVAIGNPLGQGIRAKEGTVSGLKVSLSVDQDQTLDDLIETSAAINPGNSGGPLVNMKGEVVGITSAKISAVGVEGMGYALSIQMAMPIIEQLITKGYVTRPWLGVSLYTVDQYVALINRLSVDRGAAITYVKPGSPADKAGLKQLDIIIRFQDEEIATAADLLQYLRSSQVGEMVKITFVRGKETKEVQVQLIQSPPPGT